MSHSLKMYGGSVIMRKKTFSGILLAAVLLAAGLLVLGTPVKAEPEAFVEYLVPDSDTKIYTELDIGAMDLQVTNYAKNEIYAKHGRKFVSKELTAYFNQQPWYKGTIEPSAFKDSELNEIERQNVKLLADREAALSWDGKGYELDQPGYNIDEAVTKYFSDDYNIMSGLEVYATSGTAIMDADNFSLLLPVSPQWSYIQLDRYSFEIYYKPARDAGFGGHVVSICAFDWDNTEYEEYPSWKVCGLSAAKKFIAIYPTDVQFDWNDKTQADDYGKLMDWAETLDENDNPQGNPFDGKDPEQEEEPPIESEIVDTYAE